MSYNIHYGLGTDGKKDLARIAEVITESGAQIVGLQEIGSKAMADEFGELTGMPVVFGPSKGTDSDYGDAVLCSLPFEYVGNQSIPSASSSRYQAMAIDVDLSVLAGQPTIVRFINTHFDWLDTLGSQEARLATVEVIERAFFDEDTPPSILAGDLNAIPDSPPLLRLESKGWSYDNLGTERFTWEATQPDRQIDYLLVRPVSAWTIQTVEVLDEPLASDHLPIVMTFMLKLDG